MAKKTVEQLQEEIKKLRKEKQGLQWQLKTLSKASTRALKESAVRIEKLAKLDREAATYVESPICMRTDFTGDKPYVGWKGLGLAMNEAFDERDRLKEQLALTVHALELYSSFHVASAAKDGKLNRDPKARECAKATLKALKSIGDNIGKIRAAYERLSLKASGKNSRSKATQNRSARKKKA